MDNSDNSVDQNTAAVAAQTEQNPDASEAQSNADILAAQAEATQAEASQTDAPQSEPAPSEEDISDEVLVG